MPSVAGYFFVGTEYGNGKSIENDDSEVFLQLNLFDKVFKKSHSIENV